ncbi:MAG: hypothetical protein B7Z70_15580 [Acidithiobacillus ferrivorans]|uniref:Uncharacterized protein n=1 Tax=Acidithiobacillus ferrivorans TaxID=160808 RepID=A0A257SFR4_9PROT|nr:MAG: hypothetical protein B7Z70_15580 [Acidithiobacillus ferrivorans]
MQHIKRITLLVAISGGLFASAAYADDGYVGYAIEHGAKPVVTTLVSTLVSTSAACRLSQIFALGVTLA